MYFADVIFVPGVTFLFAYIGGKLFFKSSFVFETAMHAQSFGCF